MMASSRYAEATAKVDSEKLYEPAEAVALMKQLGMRGAIASTI